MASLNGRRKRSSSARPRFPDSRRVRVKDLADAFAVAESRSHSQIERRTALEQQPDHAPVAGVTSVPDGEIDRLKIGPEPSAEAARGAESGMHVGATIEQQRGELVRTAAGRSMERRCADGVADIDEAWISVEQPADFVRVLAGDRGMNGMTVGSRQHATAAIPRLFQELCDPGMSPIARHGDQAAVMQSVPFGIGAGVEQELDRLEMSLSH